MKIGAQLYTVRLFTQTADDFSRTIKKIADIGYETVQLSAIGSSITPETAEEICRENNIEIVLTHSDGNRILHDTERLIREHEKMGCRYIGLGSMPEKYRNSDWIGRFAEDFRGPARMIRDAGMLFMYHNHDFELERLEDGRYLLEHLLDDFSQDELGITLDTYWIQAAGGDVCYWLRRCGDRIPCIHLKDRAMVKGQAVMAPVMEGNMNFKAIMETAGQMNCEYALVEQDVCLESPFTCLKKSYDNLRKSGY